MVWSELSMHADAGLLVIRLVFGCMFVYYGWPKLVGGPVSWEGVGQAISAVGIRFGFVFWGFLAAAVMVFGGFCVLTGILFRPACLFLFLVMVVAAAMHFRHGDGLKIASHAIEDGIVFLGFMFIGPGRYVLGHF
ncbi:DoxX family protein [Candidatus Velamenicoccus archaeovorus]|uniref:DoxX family protein n=1 Tax=Velamenicoccus archaeovorus TaxID=1930593 RepID=A0A410P4Q7_VELA1|nr:DoxX family protein [Candidatus Velamenicoccus archaeovorus]QAT17102.1 DoxX family protein [Candidatus Velamenicoccus archaeovorus]